MAGWYLRDKTRTGRPLGDPSRHSTFGLESRSLHEPVVFITATSLNSAEKLQRLVDRELGQIAPFADIAYENVHSRK